ncbi:MAG: hypothetical protein ACRDRZ_15625 [Pseudonocardiaceae bacterium]
MTTDTTAADPGQLRAALADYIRGRKTFRTSRVEDAFRTVPRHVFLPAVDLEAAYAPRPVVTKRADDGTAVSSASSPNLVAEMLELLDVRPGHRVLEIGAATGINAALLAELAGPTGEVVTIDVDDDLATGARAGLAAAGYHQVEVIYGDGALGHPTRAPYHRITVTAGAWTRHYGGPARPSTMAPPSPTSSCGPTATTPTSWASSPTAPTAANSPPRPTTCCTAGAGHDPASPPSPPVPPRHLMTNPRPRHPSTGHTPG